ncbi:Rv0909 family putative TA system antitoxin, partial [Nocardioides sp.]
DKTGGKFSDKIDAGTDKAADALDSLDGKNDDIR